MACASRGIAATSSASDDEDETDEAICGVFVFSGLGVTQSADPGRSTDHDPSPTGYWFPCWPYVNKCCGQINRHNDMHLKIERARATRGFATRWFTCYVRLPSQRVFLEDVMRVLSVRTLLRVVLAVCAFAAVNLSANVSPAAAACPPGGSSGSDCLPGSGYSLDRQWNCGYLVSANSCWYNGGNIGAQQTAAIGPEHTWGWGSVDYDGGGSTTVYMCARNSAGSCAFSGFGTNLVRVCYSGTCNDQGGAWLRIYMRTNPGHTVYAHAKA